MVVPEAIQNQLKKEAFYGCVVCGSPVLEFIDFKRFGIRFDEPRQQEVFLPENMIAICPSHNKKFQTHEISSPFLASCKKNPFNTNHDDLAFAINSSNELTVSLGGCTFVNTSRLLVIDDFDLINVRVMDRRHIVMDVNFLNRFNQLIGIIAENTWSSERSKIGDWTMEYLQSKRLIIGNRKENILFEARIEYGNNLRILADGLCYNSQKLRITQNEILLDGREIGADIKGTVLTNYDVGVRAESVTL
ncbi:MAG TPA: hypothetical protein VE130_01790 [Nitrososphaeraceae archaeon]|nr:hypothetical protein [Nitrososphaeraceae archaeon]